MRETLPGRDAGRDRSAGHGGSTIAQLAWGATEVAREFVAVSPYFKRKDTVAKVHTGERDLRRKRTVNSQSLDRIPALTGSGCGL